jgi:peroxiredoxin
LKDRVISGVVLAVAAGLLLVFASPTYRQGEAAQTGKPAPEFSFTLDGKAQRLADLRGKVVVLNFWATWCPPCVEEMPSLEKLHAKAGAIGALVLGVSVDRDEAAYTGFLREHQIRFPNHRDPSGRIALEYGTSMYPETYIIGKDGKIARKIVGPQNWDAPEWFEYLQALAK